MILSHSQHEELSRYYRSFLGDPAGLIDLRDSIRISRNAAEKNEDEWNEFEELQVDLEELPKTQDSFLAWYKMYEKKMNEDIAFFVSFLRHEASLEQVAYYICMEEMVDGSFDDLMAITQLGMPVHLKMVVAENYWDEMGNGAFPAVHTTMFKDSSTFMRKILAKASISLEHPPVECLMNGNNLLMWAVRREYNIRLVGGMGLVEGSAPVRFGATTAAMERLNLPNNVVAYHKAHIKIDMRHSKDWYEKIIFCYSGQSESLLRELALGVIIRYNIALRYYECIYKKMRSLK